MALFKYSRFVEQNDNQNFDLNFEPGWPARFSGVYRCLNCGREIALSAGQPVPANHHSHGPVPRPVQWRLVVYADPEPKLPKPEPDPKPKPEPDPAETT